MGEVSTRQFLDFEKPIKDLYEQIDQLRITAEKNKIDLSDSIKQLQEKIEEKKKEITDGLSSWQKVQLSRHPDRQKLQG
jgi:acetyl-CoA carboxylase carboxyl transferase subunit alpha